MRDWLLRLGGGGSLITALCCFTPILPLALGAVGLSGIAGYVYLDDVLLPLLAVFLVLTGWALWRRNRMK